MEETTTLITQGTFSETAAKLSPSCTGWKRESQILKGNSQLGPTLHIL